MDPVLDLRNLIGRRVRFRQDGVAEDNGEITGVRADLYYDLDGSEWSVMTASDLGSVADFVSDSGAFCLPLADAPVRINWDDDQASLRRLAITLVALLSGSSPRLRRGLPAPMPDLQHPPAKLTLYTCHVGRGGPLFVPR